MIKKIKSHKWNIVVQFLVPYLIILAIPVGMGVFIYEKSSQMITDEILAQNVTDLRHSRDLVDQSLEEVERLGQEIIENNKVSAYKYEDDPFTGSNIYKILELRQQLKDYRWVSSTISGYYLVFLRSELALHHDSTYRLEAFFNDIYPLHEDQQHDLLYSYHHKQYFPAQNVKIQGRTQRVIPYFQTLGHADQELGTLVIFLDHQKVQELLGGMNVSEGGSAYIMNSDGKLIAGLTEDAEPAIIFTSETEGMLMPSDSTQNMLVTYTTSSRNGWKYILVQPKEVIWKKIDFIRNTTGIVLILGLVIGIFVSLLLAYRSSKPVSRLLIHRDQMQDQLMKQQVVLRSHVVERLLRGELEEEEIPRMIEHYKLELLGPCFQVIILDCNPDEDSLVKSSLLESEERRIIAKKLVERIAGQSILFHDTEGGKVACLLSGTQESLALIQNQRDELFYDWDQVTASSRLLIAVGGQYESYMELSRSYEEAKDALFMKRWHPDHRFFIYGEFKRSFVGFDFPLDIEQRLNHLTKEGKGLEATEVLDQLFRKNIEELQQPPDSHRLFVYHLWGSFIKNLQHNFILSDDELKEIQTELNDLHLNEDLEPLFQKIKALYVKVAEQALLDKKNRQEQVKLRMLDFIHETYGQSELSLRTFAEQFSMSEGYASQVFKELVGMNFFEFVEEKRMERARALLTNTDDTVNDIASQTGYMSSNTFTRAFKRKHAQSPTEYRKQHHCK
ncbi:helix-turn-helix domain-containing protein [Paenibacillus sp. JSM ZJ436]|uniref:helix-turn-helix domain-containing protein n=1 Tax=Paenibacillus sp. JSM ZJ436 TaxID=3376190 RepID=UPI00379D6EB4